MSRSLHKTKQFFIYHTLPFFLCILIVIGFAVSSDVFVKSPARAIVPEAILPAMLQGLSDGLGVIFSAPGNTDGGQELANKVWSDFQTWSMALPNFAAYLAGLGISFADWFSSHCAVESVIRYSESVPILEYDAELVEQVWNWLTHVVSEYELSSDMLEPVVYQQGGTGVFLSDGTQLIFGSGSPPSPLPSNQTVFQEDVTYTLASGDTFSASYISGNGRYLWNDEQLGTYTHRANYPYYILNLPDDYLTNPNWRFHLRFYNSNGTGYSSFGYANQYWSENIFNSTSSLPSTYVQGEDLSVYQLPDVSEDEKGYVTLPPGLLAGIPSVWTPSDVAREIMEYTGAGYATNQGVQSMTYSVSDSIPAYNEPTAPSSVELPLLGIALPSGFTLALSSIWYYVRQWIQSISSWFSWMFGVFSSLPAAMVIPIYASAVIMIVLGMYRRFFM